MGRQATGFPVPEVLSEFQLPAGAGGGKTATAIHESSVEALLDEHPFLIDLLPEIRGKLRDYFPDSPVSLTVARDPDETDREQIVVAVITDLPPGDAINRLSEFDRDWWLDNLDQAQGKVCIDVEFG
jgi:hypothetical protein